MTLAEEARELPPELEARAAYSCAAPWPALYRGLYGYDLRSFVFRDGGAPAAALQVAVVRSFLFGTRLISLPFSDEPGLWAAGPAAPAGLAEAAAERLDALAAETGAASAELRGAELLSGSPLFSETAPYLRPVLALDRPYPELRERFHTNLLKNLRKADKTVEVSETGRPGDFSRVRHIYLRQMRGFGSPPLPAAHFERLLAAGAARLYVASVAGADAAFLFSQRRGGTFYADVNAGLPEYEAFFPKVRLFDETIRRAAAEGLKEYDFMRTRAGSGVHAHKAKWGTADRPVKYFFRTYAKGVSTALDPEEARFALARRLLRLLPLPLLAAAGPFIRKQAGK